MEANPTDYRRETGPLREGSSQVHSEGPWTERYQTVRAKAQEAVDASEDFVKTHPFYTVLGAATVGFVAGMLIRRNH